METNKKIYDCIHDRLAYKILQIVECSAMCELYVT